MTFKLAKNILPAILQILFMVDLVNNNVCSIRKLGNVVAMCKTIFKYLLPLEAATFSAASFLSHRLRNRFRLNSLFTKKKVNLKGNG